MAGLKHATKKRFAKATSSKRSIATGISAEYTEYRTKLTRLSTSIKSLQKQIHATPQTWATVAKHHTSYAALLQAALPEDGTVKAHARAVETTVAPLQSLTLENDASPYRKIASVLDAYLRMIDAVAADYSAVDTSYTEVVRYQKKVDKLQNKDKKKDTLQRNIDKLTAARTEHEAKLAAALKRMKECYERHHVVFQCAHHSFWIAQHKFAGVVEEVTRNIRAESVALQPQLLTLDINNAATLMPLQTVHVIMPVETQPTPLIEAPPQPSTVVVVPPSPNTASVTEAPSTTVAVKHAAVVGGDALPESAGKTKQQVVSSKPLEQPTGELRMPTVPTEKPKPYPRQTSANVTTPTPVGA